MHYLLKRGRLLSFYCYGYGQQGLVGLVRSVGLGLGLVLVVGLELGFLNVE